MTAAVVGLDLSLTATCVATADRLHVIPSEGHKGDNLVSRALRLQSVANRVFAEVARAGSEAGGPLLVVIEAPAFSRTTGHHHDRSGLWWLIVSELMSWDRVDDVVEVQPTTLKKYATGNGQADKYALRMALYQRAGIDERNDNKVDAWWLRHMGLDYLGEPTLVLPKTHRAALEAVAWPVLAEIIEEG